MAEAVWGLIHQGVSPCCTPSPSCSSSCGCSDWSRPTPWEGSFTSCWSSPSLSSCCGSSADASRFDLLDRVDPGSRAARRRGDLAMPHVREQAVQLLLDHRIALASVRLQAGALDHGDVAAAIAYEAGLLQLPGGLGNALPPHPQHAGDQFLGHDEIAAGNPVEREQQPAAKLLLDRMVAVAGRGLDHLRDERLRVAQQQA